MKNIINSKFNKDNQSDLKYTGVKLIESQNISIGERVSFGGNCYIYGLAPVQIGHDTMVASGVVIETRTHDHNNHPMWKHCVTKPVNIGNHVWIGINAIILPGVVVDDYAVIGAGTVVTKHVPKGAVIAGNPAKIIKYRKFNKDEPNSIKYPGIFRHEG